MRHRQRTAPRTPPWRGVKRLLAAVALAAVGIASAALLRPSQAAARDRAPLFLRAGLGGGYGGIGTNQRYDGSNNVGGALAWDGAVGGFVARFVALHGSLFGHFAPDSVAKDGESSRTRGKMWVQSIGAGVTLTPPLGFRRAPRLRVFLSSSLGLAIVEDHLWTHGGAGIAAQLLMGFELSLPSGLRLGLALQGAYEQRNKLGVFGRPYADFEAGHAAGLLTITFDTRRRATRPR